MFDNHVGTMLIGYRSAKTCFDLFGNRKIVKDRHIAIVKFDNLFSFRSDQSHITFHFIVNIFIVYIDIFIGRIEEVAEECHCTAGFFKAQERKLWLFSLSVPDNFGDHIFPSFEQDFEFAIQFSHPLPFSNSTDDYAEVARLDAVYELFESGSFSSALDFGRNRDFVTEGDENQVSSGKGNLASQARTFGVDGFLDNLHQDLLSLFKYILYAAVLFRFRLVERLA
ncbi:hypothetical protein EVA_16134 [gut metagenome]|uniref:Uncharacterized protein n=1 Tax=gut metagenome TaxID=749906 RepID=J9G1S1_9ZZZZ